MSAPADPVETFIARWQAAGGSERANYQLFVTELCELLALPKPEPAMAETADNAYVFERRVIFPPRRAAAASERLHRLLPACLPSSSKPSRSRLSESLGTNVFDDALLRARSPGRELRPRPARRGRPAALPGGGRCRQRDRAVCRVLTLRRHLHAVSRPALAIAFALAELRDPLDPRAPRRLLWLDPLCARPDAPRRARHAPDRLPTSPMPGQAAWKEAGHAPGNRRRLPHPLPVQHVRRGCRR
jgi:hypothetical protein